MTPAEKVAAAKPLRKDRRQRPVTAGPWHCTVRQHRQRLRLSLRDVAGAVGASIAGLSAVELGRDPMLSTARKLATFFGVGIEELWPKWKGDDV